MLQNIFVWQFSHKDIIKKNNNNNNIPQFLGGGFKKQRVF